MTTLSVVVIGRNEGERLRKCLASIKNMHRGAWKLEIIYVDSKSADTSVATAHAMGATVIELAAARTTAAMGRNAGWRAASGETIFFLDGDTIVHPSFALDNLHRFADPAVAVIWGHRREMFPRSSKYNRILDLDWCYPAGDTAFCGGDSLFRRESLEVTGGFDDTLIAGEEPELCRRIAARGWRIVHVDSPMTGHDLAIHSFRQYWLRAVRAGHAYSEVAARFAGTSDPFWSDEVRRTRIRMLGLTGGAMLSLLLAVALRSKWPLAVCATLFVALVFRTAWRARWKTGSIPTLLLYGLHSQLQHIPIYIGTLRYKRHAAAGSNPGILEYK